MVSRKIYLLILVLCWSGIIAAQQNKDIDQLRRQFRQPPEGARPWVFWYWMHGAVSRAGITADLEAMKSVGIGGAYLMPIKDTTAKIPFQAVVRQLTPEWWQMVHHAMKEAKRLGLKLGMHVSDGFALAGGPWITPELSMQKLTWSKTVVTSGSKKIILPRPPAKQGYYKDVAVYAYPLAAKFRSAELLPEVSASDGSNPRFLAAKQEGTTQAFRSDTGCWIQYSYPEPITCRSIRITSGSGNYQAQRLIIQTSDDGVNFTTVTRLNPPRHGWQDNDEPYTHAVQPITSKHLRFVYDKPGTEPGAEELDAAKWRPSLRLTGIHLSAEPVIHQFEAKNGSVWRLAAATTFEQVSNTDAVPADKILDLSAAMDSTGTLLGDLPAGDWVIIRIGHTSTGHTNYTGGGGLGLECDKFNAAAVRLQFDNWFGKAFSKTDPALAKQVLKIFHVDSWECGSQNWTSNFPAEFQKRRGYSLMPYLVALTGVPVNDGGFSEKLLHDVRTTIAELVNDVFYRKLRIAADKKGCSFSAESIAPTMMSDALMHYRYTDLPMGEFWLNSPTHDKPNDMLDAVSGAHIYGKQLVQAESFTSVRMNWTEHPGSLKILGDRNFALGANKLVLHVFTHNPWLNKKPGMTLDGVGLYYQRDQTWFRQSKAWIDYLSRCQALLQLGKPVIDLAVFTGEDLPRRSPLPDKLINSLPGLFGANRIEREATRLQNAGQPLRQIPDAVTHGANMYDAADWVNPLNGYQYDAFNPDVLMQMRVVKGRVQVPGGLSYAALVFPGMHAMNPNDHLVSVAVLEKIHELLNGGAKILMTGDYLAGIGRADADSTVRSVLRQIMQHEKTGRLVLLPYRQADLSAIGTAPDLLLQQAGQPVAWTHRRWKDNDIYFVSNQSQQAREVVLSLRAVGKSVYILDPVSGALSAALKPEIKNNRTILHLPMEAAQSLFVVVSAEAGGNIKLFNSRSTSVMLPNEWELAFDTSHGGPVAVVKMDSLVSWTTLPNDSVKYYSGTAIYKSSFVAPKLGQGQKAFLVFDSIYNIATVRLNGKDCGTTWTAPHKIEVTEAIRNGLNQLHVSVSNTWHNRLIGDNILPAEKRITWTTAPFRLKGKPLQPAGIVGRVKLELID